MHVEDRDPCVLQFQSSQACRRLFGHLQEGTARVSSEHVRPLAGTVDVSDGPVGPEMRREVRIGLVALSSGPNGGRGRMNTEKSPCVLPCGNINNNNT